MAHHANCSDLSKMPRKRILITGGNGKLATAICTSSAFDDFDLYAPPSTELDVTILESVITAIETFKPHYVIHAAAFTKPMRKHAEKPCDSIYVNIIGTSHLAMASIDYSFKLIYISTDYVYPGVAGNYSEESPLYPFSECYDGISCYGWSKLGGECSVRLVQNALIIRASLCDYPFPHDYALADVTKSLIYTTDAAPLIAQLLDESGVINLGGPSKTVLEFVRESNSAIKPITRAEISDVRIAPNTSMNLSKLKRIINKE